MCHPGVKPPLLTTYTGPRNLPMGKQENQLSTDDTWGTPPRVWQPLADAFGGIAFDPFGHPSSTVVARRKLLLPMHWTAENTALLELSGFELGDAEHDWIATPADALTFCNGPYSDLWWCEAAVQHQHARDAHTVLFVPVRTSGAAWQRAVLDAAVICLLNFRVKHTGAAYGAPFHQALAYFGAAPERFAAAVKGMGRLVCPEREQLP